MYFREALHEGTPWFMLAVFTLLVGLVMSVTVRGSGIARYPYSKPHDGGELASDLPQESIGRPEVEPLLVLHSPPPERTASNALAPSGTPAPAPGAAS
jgi:hypothetical protein